jgi:GWxTD domain-containing protein
MQFRKILIVTMSLGLIAGIAMGQDEGDIAQWGKGPASHLMTKEEQKTWKKLETPQEMEEFIKLFWAKRDPTPETPVNEFRDEMDRRVQYANNAFTTGRTVGSMSDRGEVFIVVGPPYTRKTSSEAPTTNIQTPSSPGAAPREEIWVYEKDKLPAFAGMPVFEITFIDQNFTGNWKLGHTPGVDVGDLLEKARNYYVISPDLTELPSYEAYFEAQRKAAMLPPPPKAAIEAAALTAAIDGFKGDNAAGIKSAPLTYGEYLTPDGQYYVPVQLYFDSEAGVAADQEVTFFGVLENAGGQVVAAYEEPSTVRSNKAGESYVDRSLIIEPGSYKAVFGVASGEQVLAMGTSDLELEGVSPTEPSISRLVLSRNIFALTEAQMPTDPYAFGGLKVVPEGDLEFSQDDEMWYFFELRNPGIDPSTNTPKVQVQIEVATEVDGQSKKRRAPMMEATAQPVKDTPGHFIVGSSIPLSGFDVSDYEIKIKVIDSVARKTYNLEGAFKVLAGTGQPAATQ